MSKLNRKKYEMNEENIAKFIMGMKRLLHYCEYNNMNINSKGNNDRDEGIIINDTEVNRDNTEEKVEEIICKEECETNYCKKNKTILNVPIIIGMKLIDVPLQSKIRLKDWTSEIRKIKSDVRLLDSKVIKLKFKESGSSGKKGKLFIKGILKNNIEYTSIDNTDKNCINGSIKYTSVYIPFHCVTLIDFSSSKIYSNKPIYCDIKNAKVMGSNLYVREKSIKKIFIMDKAFKEFEQKIVLKLTLSLTQEQQIE